jgi:hypothetical protein
VPRAADALGFSVAPAVAVARGDTWVDENGES